MVDYSVRLLDSTLTDTLAGLPAVMVTGPRACGKTTTARRHVDTVVRLDRPREAAAFIADPDDALRQTTEPALFDEWQAVPGVLGAIKRRLDDEEFRPHRYVLTGSARPLRGSQEWLGTGRVVDVRMDPLTRREIVGRVGGALFIDRLFGGSAARFDPAEPATLSQYVAWALEGGFPEAVLAVGPSHRARWLAGYIERLVTHDVQEVGGPRDADSLRRYLRALATQTAGVVPNKTLYEVADIAASTARSYDQLLCNMFVTDIAPAWSTNRYSRLVDTPKRYLVDGSLVASLLNLTSESVFADGVLLGRIIDTFVMAQLRPETQASVLRPRLHHLRDKDGRHEIDMIVELASGEVAAVEVRAAAAPSWPDFRHLRWLRDLLGDRFVRGVLLHSGPRAIEVDDRIVAAPMSTLWL